MKKIYIIMIALLFSAGAFAQIPGQPNLKLRHPASVPTVPYNSERTTSSIWLDYDSADAYNFGVSNSIFIWNMNKRYSESLGDTSWNFCIVRFDSLYDVYTNTAIDRNNVTSITVDSIYTFLGHENFSGNNDTLITRIVNLDASRYPGTATLWADTTVTDTSLSPGGNWLMAQYLQWNPAYTIPAGGKGFAIELDYYDPSRVDTIGFLAGYNDKGACGSTGLTTSASLSNFYPNSYAYWMRYAQILPNATGGDIYYDCNANGQYDAGIDGSNFMQDILIGAFVTVNYTTGIKEDLKNTGMGLYQNVPNPANNTTNIRYELANNAQNVVLSVFDIVGNKVMEVNEGSKPAGKYNIQLDASRLAKGMYTYTLRTDGSQLTRKMIIE